MIKAQILKFSLTIAALFSCALCSAHSRWVIPSHTVLSGELPEYVSFDFSVSNDIFHPDNAYGGVPIENVGKPQKEDSKALSPREVMMRQMMASTKLAVQTPDGKTDDSTPVVNVGRKSVSGYKFDQSGTYRVSVEQNPIYFISFEHEDGSPGREFGKLSEKKASLPKGAKNIKGAKLINRVETYITRHQATQKNIQPTNKGLELKFDTHPNDLFAGEKFVASLLLNGKPVEQGMEVLVIRGGTRYRNDRNVNTITTDAKGKIEVEWDSAGMYLLESSAMQKVKNAEYHAEMFGLYVTLEVSPE